jgi:hypothetical protein
MKLARCIVNPQLTSMDRPIATLTGLRTVYSAWSIHLPAG